MYEFHYSLMCRIFAVWVGLHSFGQLNQVRGLQQLCPGLIFFLLLVKICNVLLLLKERKYILNNDKRIIQGCYQLLFIINSLLIIVTIAFILKTIFTNLFSNFFLLVLFPVDIYIWIVNHWWDCRNTWLPVVILKSQL